MSSLPSSFPHPTRPVSIDQYNAQQVVYDETFVHGAQLTEDEDREGLDGLLGFVSELIEKVPAKLEHILLDKYMDHRENEGPVIVERGTTTTTTSRGLQGTGESSPKLERFKIRTVDFGDDVKEEENVKR
ncbi:hypothetical protein RchiOBHm_Chr3g0472321 [Rosa chinensis]|uniref:Uncharacterized protein n=1 Tax=Rosa chinensis TaxID=74649 RepID=A0A2P6RBJ0_ROSCH|nr:hypothetical protein RchiOBHm_Chr3g0472321 [Rosa chinensis]